MCGHRDRTSISFWLWGRWSFNFYSYSHTRVYSHASAHRCSVHANAYRYGVSRVHAKAHRHSISCVYAKAQTHTYISARDKCGASGLCGRQHYCRFSHVQPRNRLLSLCDWTLVGEKISGAKLWEQRGYCA